MAGTLRDTRGYASIEWKIKNFSELENDHVTLSAPFLLSDTNFVIALAPTSTDLDGREEFNGSINLCLISKVVLRPNQLVRFTLGIKASNGSVYKASEKEYGFYFRNFYSCHDFIQRSRLFEMKDILLPEDTLTIFCVARLVQRNGVDTASQTVSPEGSTALIENLRELYQKGNFDVKINVKGKEFQAHRSVLAARSPVFASTLFDKNTTEKKTGDVEITDCDPNSFGDFLLYLYTGQMGRVSADNVFDIYRTAKKFDVKELRAKCAQYMACDLSVDTFCDAYLTAVIHNEVELLDNATEFFIENGKTILGTRKRQFFMKNYHTLVEELVAKATDRN